uniref:Allorecognition 2 n=1 Tax=Timema douglasi TaxID=61478 RepID=A0A7R8VH85_TIMDO|nr:unnamed protein product [Timema douglasi]
MANNWFAVIFGSLFLFNYVESYFVTLSHNGPVVRGANITFKAELFNAYGEPPSGTFRFRWQDNAIPRHISESEGPETAAHWIVSYPASHYDPGPYEVEVSVDKSTIFFWPISSQRIIFNVTAMLNGQIALIQSDRSVNGKFISNSRQVTHQVQLTKPDYEYLAANSTSILTYWFVDCVYYGSTSDYSLKFNYTEAGKEHNVEALVVAYYEPPTTTPVPTTPTTTTTTTTTSTTTTNKPTTQGPGGNTTTTTPTPRTMTPPTTTVLPSQPHNSSSELSNDVNLAPTVNTNVSEPNTTIDLPFVCLNSSVISPDPKKTYGYFHKLLESLSLYFSQCHDEPQALMVECNFVLTAPVSQVDITGSNWLKHGDILNLTVAFTGSPNFTYCTKLMVGTYNITGNEVCKNDGRALLKPKFPIIHYFQVPDTYTLIVIINNDISKTITPVTVNIYEVTKQAQLSVIVVPVSCSIVAVILIVFGANDMEYKTFNERLRESVSNTFNRSSDYVETENVWSPSRKYGSMQ